MNKSFELTGTLLEKFDLVELTSTFSKRDFVIEIKTSSEKSETITFALLGSNSEIINELEIGDMITVSFNIKGRKWISPENETKYFNALEAYRVIKEENSYAPSFSDTSGDGNDLPF